MRSPLQRIALVALAWIASCVSTVTSERTTLVELDVDGSPRVLPGGPSLYVDDVYRGNPVDGRFRMWLTVGEHEARVMSGSEPLWEGVLAVEPAAGTQVIEIRYDVDVTGGGD